jgi:hypothetical protein
LHGIPGEAEQGRRSAHRAAGLKDFDSEGFKEKGETGVLASPGRNDCLHAMLRTSASRKAGDQLRRELHGVEMTPTSFFGMIRKATGTATFQAGDAGANMHEPNLDSPFFEPKVHGVNPPGVVQPEQSGIMRRECFHPGNLRQAWTQNDRLVPRNSPKNHNW